MRPSDARPGSDDDRPRPGQASEAPNCEWHSESHWPARSHGLSLFALLSTENSGRFRHTGYP
eukprot:747436-Hanusia_phi.AAC.3